MTPFTLLLLIALSEPGSPVCTPVCELCPGDPLPSLPVFAAREESSLIIDADRADLSTPGVTVLSGDVELDRADQRLNSDQLTVFHEEDRGTAQGAVLYRDAEYGLEADSLRIDLDGETASAVEARYYLLRAAGKGEAATIDILDRTTARLEKVRYTTCPPGDRDWELSASRVRLDNESGRGTARNAWLRFQNVPILFLPYFNFPIDDRRQTGFLYPSIEYGDDDGFDIRAPFYINIAPNYDATLYPRYIGRRGAVLGGEFRYLQSHSFGQIEGEWLPNDQIVDQSRSFARWQHYTQLGPRFDFRLDLNHISDPDYFQDLGDSLDSASISYLRSLIGFRAYGDWYEAELLMDFYDDIANESIDNDILDPYSRVPRATFTADRGFGVDLLRARLDAEAVRFQRNELSFGSFERAFQEGWRFDALPLLRLADRPTWGFWEIGGGARLTAYRLDEEIGTSDSELPFRTDEAERTVPIAFADTGLVFERSWGERMHTIEPRLFYAYAADENQDDLPIFDTRESTFRYDQLFALNRFTGPDRQGDINRLSIGVTSRFYSAGRELLTVRAGQGFYLDENEVQLPAASDAYLGDFTPAVLELDLHLTNRLALRSSLQYDHEFDDAFDELAGGIRYRSDHGGSVSFEYRKRERPPAGSILSQVSPRDPIEQVDLSFYQPIGSSWAVLGRLNYSLENDTLIEGLGGFSYESCCWAVRFVARRYVRNDLGETRDGFFVELELKGFGAIGQTTSNLLDRAINGFRY